MNLGPGPFDGDFETSAPVELAGTDGTVIRADPAFTFDEASAIHNVRIEGRLATTANLTLDDVDLGRLVMTEADVTGRGVTLTDGAALDGGALTLTSSLVGADDPFTVTGDATVTTAFSAHADDEDATAGDRSDPPADPRALDDPALVDRGDPAPLQPFEPFEDAAGYPRIAGGRRDIGAYETQPSPVPMSPSSVLVNGGAEDGLAGWSGSFAAAAYGDPFLPTALAGRALGGGARFFARRGRRGARRCRSASTSPRRPRRSTVGSAPPRCRASSAATGRTRTRCPCAPSSRTRRTRSSGRSSSAPSGPPSAPTGPTCCTATPAARSRSARARST